MEKQIPKNEAETILDHKTTNKAIDGAIIAKLTVESIGESEIEALAFKLHEKIERARISKSVVLYAECCDTFIDSKHPFASSHPAGKMHKLKKWLGVLKVRDYNHLLLLLKTKLHKEIGILKGYYFDQGHGDMHIIRYLNLLKRQLRAKEAECSLLLAKNHDLQQKLVQKTNDTRQLSSKPAETTLHSQDNPLSTNGVINSLAMNATNCSNSQICRK